MEGYEDFETVSWMVINGLRMSHCSRLGEYGYGVHSNFRKDGIELKAGFTLLKTADETIEQISAEVENIERHWKVRRESIRILLVGEMVAEDGFVMQQLICNQIGADGVAYPCAEIICSSVDGGPGNSGEQCIFEYFSGNRKHRAIIYTGL